MSIYVDYWKLISKKLKKSSQVCFRDRKSALKCSFRFNDLQDVELFKEWRFEKTCSVVFLV